MAHQSDVAVHGRKRPADGELDGQPLTKKFGQLQIGPLATLHLLSGRSEQARRLPNTLQRHNDAMLLDDTATTLYIHDLEQELAEAEALEGALTILPGLEGRLSMTKMLVADNSKSPCNEIVLYREPESLSIPKDKDQVRRALIETRERARSGLHKLQGGMQQKNDSGYTSQNNVRDKDHANHRDAWSEDVMDIDADV
ncbi:uncharacterized protein DSM5745_05372 [Aspergillus mulundensis]|uniref:Uncharacterized protein n=1 Tax=Aspergillus mulundensis TaxID=1810919 RepID=A0A3D8S675_9EURO|nr:hypothetical protein DSM5745_05372 [Aspergillus mulundensis]RDW81815.1 hypothetical protein DSM5745_05372 [Aspergillus mulundensis]